MKVLLVEFNELTPSLMDRFIAEGHLPNFARMRRESRVYVTQADERDHELEPWIQWVTVHSGLPYRQHRVTHLGQGHDLKSKRVWDVAAEHGKRLLICGSMNAYTREAVRGYFLPDPWAAQAGPQPDSLLPFFRFVQANVQDHARDTETKGGGTGTFLRFMLRNGLSWRTAWAIVRQIVAQRLDPRKAWRRAVILDRLQFDLFRRLYGRGDARPDLATFFSNSTAHFQHHFWRHMQPELYRHKPSAADAGRYGSAILYGYAQMDRMLGELLDMTGDDTAVVFCTALSQEACLKYEHLGGGTSYRPKDYGALLRYAGVVSPFTVEQAMASRFGLRFRDPAEAKAAAEALDALWAGDQKAILQVELQDSVIFLDCGFHDGPLEDLPLRRTKAGAEDARFGDFFYAYAQFNGMHNPDGMLWIRLPGKKGEEIPGKVPLTAVAPTILSLMGLPPGPEMGVKPLDLAA